MLHVTLKMLSVMRVGILHKTSGLEDLLHAYNLDITALYETWLHDGILNQDVVPVSQDLVHHDRN